MNNIRRYRRIDKSNVIAIKVWREGDMWYAVAENLNQAVGSYDVDRDRTIQLAKANALIALGGEMKRFGATYDIDSVIFTIV